MWKQNDAARKKEELNKKRKWSRVEFLNLYSANTKKPLDCNKVLERERNKLKAWWRGDNAESCLLSIDVCTIAAHKQLVKLYSASLSLTFRWFLQGHQLTPQTANETFNNGKLYAGVDRGDENEWHGSNTRQQSSGMKNQKTKAKKLILHFKFN